MRSALLFVAVLLACTPVHGQTTGPVEAPILHFWLAGILPAPSAEAGEKSVAKRRRPVQQAATTYARVDLLVDAPGSTPVVPRAAADLLLHSPNAP